MTSHSHSKKLIAAISAAAVIVCTVVIVGVVGFLRLGPPSVTMAEAYTSESTATFSHERFDGVLKKHVDDAGYVDYASLATDDDELDTYIESLAAAPFDELGRDDKLALLINAYNAFTLRLILDYWDDGELASIRDIPEARRWADRRWLLAGRTLSLDAIEHEEIRKHFVEPRIHFAVVCAAVSCPTLRDEAYVGERIEAQLADQAAYVHSHDRWFNFDRDAGVVHLTKLYDWYAGDFEQQYESVIAAAAMYDESLATALSAGENVKTAWISYDWSLNDVRRRP